MLREHQTVWFSQNNHRELLILNAKGHLKVSCLDISLQEAHELAAALDEAIGLAQAAAKTPGTLTA